MTTTETTPARRARRNVTIGAGLTLAAGLVLAAPLAASAHVTVSPDAASAGDSAVLTFAFSHGCEQSPTSSLTIDVPEGVASIAPQIEPGWSIERLGGNEGIPDQIVFTADAPVESGLRATVTIQVNFSEDVAGDTVAFPVVQTCVDGKTEWTQIADEGEDPHDLDAPAPTVLVAASTMEDHHGGASAAHDESADDTAGQATTVDASAADPTPIVLGAAGLALGVAALAVGIIALRRTRSRTLPRS
ncbi:MAG: YcnI family protein [Microbacterium pygmaeum]